MSTPLHHSHIMLRASGRTYRMLNQVAERELAGQKSLVICATAEQMRRLELSLRTLLAPHEHTMAHTVFAVPTMGLNWTTLRVDGVAETQQVFVDHFAIEMHLSRVLDELHRYDPPETLT